MGRGPYLMCRELCRSPEHCACLCMHVCMASYHSAGGVVNVVFYVRHGEVTVSAVIIAVVNTVLHRPEAQDSPHIGSEHHHHYHHFIIECNNLHGLNVDKDY